MKDGFVSVSAVTPQVKVADVKANVDACLEAVRNEAAAGARVIVLPELALTSYTCQDLFFQDTLINAAQTGALRFLRETQDIDALIMVGAPVRVNAKLYNCALVCHKGRLLGIVPKTYLPNYGEFYELRHFSPASAECGITPIEFAGQQNVLFGPSQLFTCSTMPQLIVGVEICEDLWSPKPPSIDMALAGATLICNLSASNAVVGKAAYRKDLVVGQSARLVCAYVYASAGAGESTQDLVFSGHNLIAENGVLLAQAKPFSGEPARSQIDVSTLCLERSRLTTFDSSCYTQYAYQSASFDLALAPTKLTRYVDSHPFVPDNPLTLKERCEDIFAIQAHGLASRVLHTHSRCLVVGLSGGLDSTLALLVCVKACELAGLDASAILALTMPGFGTTTRTHSNAKRLAQATGARLREISIDAAVRQHFMDIGHAQDNLNVVYENAQARERTQILMDVANEEGGLVVGTGDLSELVLGWATYNADHMSMYGVNAGVPKTLVRHLVRYVADTTISPEVRTTLLDVLDTPVSPELLPANQNGTIAQKTEDLVGPYELHDFFTYQVLRKFAGPTKVYRLACYAFKDVYEPATILAWLKVFYRRFFAQQFKRSCLPDGPKVGSVAVSPRGDLRMPSDASCALWQAELDKLNEHSIS